MLSVDGAGSGVDADLLDGLAAGQVIMVEAGDIHLAAPPPPDLDEG